MKKEDIEKAAGEYSGSILGFKDNPYVMRTHKAFADGAQWAINSVWHTDISEGQTCRIVLVHFNNGCSSLFDDIRDLTGIEDRVKAFAYLDELFPERKEESE